MFESQLWPALREYWHPVAVASDVAEKPVPVRLLDERLVLARLDGKIVCFHDLCIHRGTPLSLGWVEDSCLVCAYHGWAYAADGACVRIPSLPPEQGIPRKARATAYQAEERYGLVWVLLGEHPRAPIPFYPEYDDPAYRTILVRNEVWKASAARLTENFMDESHFPWVHEGILGDRAHPESPEIHFGSRPDGLHYEYDLKIVGGGSGFSTAPSTRHVYDVILPFTTRLGRVLDTQRVFQLHFICTPYSVKETGRFCFLSRNYGLNEPDEKFVGAMPVIHEQDGFIVENQRPEELPLDLTAEFHLRGPDTAALEYRRMLRELGLTGAIVA